MLHISQAFDKVNPWATKLFCDIGYQGVGGYHQPLNFVVILFKKIYRLHQLM